MAYKTNTEIEQALSSQFRNLDKASKQVAAGLWEREDLADIVEQALEGRETEVLGRERLRIVAIIRYALESGLTVKNAAQVVVDTIRKCVAESRQSTAVANPELIPEGTSTMDSTQPERPDIAALLGLPSFNEAVRIVQEHQKTYANEASRLPEKKVFDERGGFSIEIPRPNY